MGLYIDLNYVLFKLYYLKRHLYVDNLCNFKAVKMHKICVH